MIYQRIIPFRSEPSKNIFLASHVDENNFNDKVATVEQELYIDNQATLTIPIVASSTCTITFFFGASLNTAKALEKKTGRARRNIMRRGPGNVQRARILQGGITPQKKQLNLAV